MVARYKPQCSKPGKVIRRTWPTRNERSITAPCATAKHGSVNTPKIWKPPRQPHKRRKRLNVLDFGLIEERVVKRTRDKLIRVSIVMVTSLAWISISNHCALGALIAKTNSAVAPMHCHGNQPVPSKKSSEEEMPCCKLLRATVTSDAKIVQVASKNFLPAQIAIIAEIIFANQARLHRTPLELDIGPPFVDSFAESVLQRSILVHAPPSLV